jgi:leucyl/phenylalanyl-tRNA--protein transferase
MRQSARRFDVRIDTSFGRVIRACADPSREDGWITADFIAAYERLHGLGWAHSVEVFDREGELAGGLYGVRIGRMFAGESMFHHKRDASKVALMALVDLMRESGMTLLDAQWCTEHLASLGAIAIRVRLPRPAEATRRQARAALLSVLQPPGPPPARCESVVPFGAHRRCGNRAAASGRSRRPRPGISRRIR